jgi:hypothetical protein
MAFTHIVMFKWREEGFDDRPFEEALLNLVPGLDGVQSYRCGRDVGRTPASYDFAIVGVFDSREHFEAYRDHPEHQRIVAEISTPNVGSRSLVQLED